MVKSLASYVEVIIRLVGQWSYPGVFLLSLLDRLTVFFIPAEVVVPAFGLLISQGVFAFWPVFIWLTLGNFIGNMLLYVIFLRGGRVFLEKCGRYFLISPHDLHHFDRLFLKYGNKLVLFGYLIPTAIRSLVPIPAGIAKMNPGRFAIYTFLGSLPLNILYVFAGMKAGDHLKTILGYVEKINYVVIPAVLIVVGLYIYRHIKHKHLTHD